MTKTNKRIFTRMTAIILAVIALLSAFSGLKVNAKAGDKVNVTFGYCYDTGGSIIKFAKKVTNNGITVGTAGEALCKIFANKKESYCIQPGISLHSGDKLTESGSTVWKKLGAAKQRGINHALLYGKGGNAKNLSGTADQKWVATQLIIWEFVAGCRKTASTYACTDSKFIDGMCSGGKNPGVKTVYNQISNGLKEHSTVPSFAAELASKAKTHTMKASSGKYTVTLTDSNKVLSKFDFKKTDGVTVSKSGNKLTVSSTKPVKSVTFSSNKDVPTVAKKSVIIPYGDSSKQDVITGVENAPDPVKAYFKVTAKGGTLKLKKTSEDGKVSGIKFTITGPNSYKKTVSTNSKGEFELDDLYPGTYTVTENKYSRYVAQKAQTVKVEAGKTATVSFKNVLKPSDFKIVKKDAVTKKVIEIAGFKFKIKDSDGKFVKVDGTDTFETDDEGVVSFETKLPVGKYQLIEVAAGEGYLLDGTPKDFEVKSDSTKVEIEKYDYPEMGTITISKTGDVFSSVTESEDGDETEYQPVYKTSNLEGAQFEIRAKEDIDTGDGTIRVKKGELVDTVTTDEDGKVKSKELYLGTYVIKETKTPDGYISDGKEYEVTIKFGGETVEVTNADIKIQNTRQKAEVSLTKVMEKDEQYGIGDNDEILNVRFGLYANEEITAENGDTIPADGLIEVISVSEDGSATFKTDLPVGNYYVKEIATDSKYVLDDTQYEFTFDATDDKEIQHIDINNGEDIENKIAYGTAKTIKVDADYPDNKLTGATFEIYFDKDGDKQYNGEKDSLVGEMNEVSEGVYELGELPIGGYLLFEKEAPLNFLRDENYHYFEIKEDKEVVTVENEAGVGFINKPAVGTVKIIKVDKGYPENKLSGAVFEIYADKDGNKEYTEKTDTLIGEMKEIADGEYELGNLRIGGYLLYEKTAPKNFVKDDNYYYFEITKHEEVVTVENEAGKGFINKPALGTAKTIKVDADYPKNKLTGAVFEVYADKDGNKKFAAKTDSLVGEMKEIKKGEYQLGELRVGGYFLYEKTAPTGFVKDDKYYYFEIKEDKEIVNVENKAGVGFINKPETGYLEITKRDVSDGKLLPDAGFRIKDEKGKTVVEGYTDKNGIAKFKLRVGKYTYEEFDAPDGYIIDTKPHKFEIKKNGEIVKAKMTNKKQPTPHTPQTGADNNFGFFIGLGAIAIGGLIAFLIVKFRKKDEDDDD